MPAALCPDVGDVAAPHLIGALIGELAVQPVPITGNAGRGLGLNHIPKRGHETRHH